MSFWDGFEKRALSPKLVGRALEKAVDTGIKAPLAAKHVSGKSLWVKRYEQANRFKRRLKLHEESTQFAKWLRE